MKRVVGSFGIDFSVKEFLGRHNDKLYGTYKYEGAVGGQKVRECMCKPSEMLIAPDGEVHVCHGNLYGDWDSWGHVLEDNFRCLEDYRKCGFYGLCNPCDIKTKTNRFQEYGHCSVEIKEVK